MIAFLRWMGRIFASVFNSLAKVLAFAVILLGVAVVIGLARGDGLPGNTVLTLDLRSSVPDSAGGPAFPFATRPVTTMDLLFALDDASRDKRIKGLVMRMGGGMSLAQAQELSTAIARFRAKGKFVIAQATGFSSPGMGDYLAATAADEIWVQPHADFAVAGAGAGEVFLKGFFDKIKAVPEMVKRAEYKSAADMFTESAMSAPDREQMNALMNSWYSTALSDIAAARRLKKEDVRLAFEASPQFSEDALSRKLVDRIGFDDDALAAGSKRAGEGAKAVKMGDYIKTRSDETKSGANIAVIVASGEIKDGTSQGGLMGGSSGIASDDMSAAIRQATRDAGIKAIVLRVDSPGGSVTASDQILDAVKKAQKAGKPVVVTMGPLAASGGYYISASANAIVAQPTTLTGSIGVLTGKVSFGGTAELIGVKVEQVSIGKNTLMDSPAQPFTPEQWAALNHQADVIYADFLQKVADGRKLPLEKVQAAAKGRVWTGADAKAQGLVNDLGGFWTAVGLAANLGHIPADQAVFRVYPKPKGFLDGITRFFDDTQVSMGVMSDIALLLDLPGVRSVVRAVADAPRGGVELRAPNLPQPVGN